MPLAPVGQLLPKPHINIDVPIPQPLIDQATRTLQQHEKTMAHMEGTSGMIRAGCWLVGAILLVALIRRMF